jgi:putative cardiolipin synthase
MKRALKILASIVLVLAVAVLGLRLAFPLPDIADRPVTTVPATDPEATLVRASAARAAQAPELSGILPLLDGTDALASRLELIRLAERSVDAQYYIWQDDISGILLLGALRDAALRGVKVRLLLDDNGVPGMDGHLASLDAIEGFEVRLYNPSTVRAPKMLGYAFDFFRMNRRMHNKSFIVDGAVAVIGGRNIGDDYFQIGAQFYVDMDVLGVGAVVADTRAIFEEYWNAGSVFAIGTVVDGTGDLAAFDARLAEIAADPETAALLPELESSAARLADGAADLEWTRVQIVADDPIKGEGIAESGDLMITRLTEIMGGVEERLDLVSAYFIPGEVGTETFAALARGGRTVNLMTNALDTTDVLLVHAGYAKYRRELLESGADLFEMKLRGATTPRGAHGAGPFGLSGASLHAKTFAIDGERIFIGSFNFDPRSALLNTEMGFLIDSPTLARDLASRFDEGIPAISYLPTLTPDGDMVWSETTEDGETVLYQKEPGASWLEQVMLTVIGALPIEWML